MGELAGARNMSRKGEQTRLKNNPGNIDGREHRATKMKVLRMSPRSSPAHFRHLCLASTSKKLQRHRIILSRFMNACSSMNSCLRRTASRTPIGATPQKSFQDAWIWDSDPASQNSRRRDHRRALSAFHVLLPYPLHNFPRFFLSVLCRLYSTL